MTLEELRERLKAHSLERYSAAIEQTTRPYIRLQLERVDEEEMPLGTSKMGGRPDLPPSFDWPYELERPPSNRDIYFKLKKEPRPLLPLSFLAQINFAEFTGFETDVSLPSSGIAYFFYSCEQDAWGFDTSDRAVFKVLFYDGDTKDLEQHQFPDELPEHGRFTPCRLTGKQEVGLPEYTRESMTIFESQDDVQAYLGMYLDDELVNKILGFSDPIQGPMELECELIRNGQYVGDGKAVREANREIRERARDWQLLLQIDSNEEDCGMMWGDLGRLYFWIRKQDLAAKQFDQCWMILQCS